MALAVTATGSIVATLEGHSLCITPFVLYPATAAASQSGRRGPTGSGKTKLLLSVTEPRPRPARAGCPGPAEQAGCNLNAGGPTVAGVRHWPGRLGQRTLGPGPGKGFFLRLGGT